MTMVLLFNVQQSRVWVTFNFHTASNIPSSVPSRHSNRGKAASSKKTKKAKQKKDKKSKKDKKQQKQNEKKKKKKKSDDDGGSSDSECSALPRHPGMHK